MTGFAKIKDTWTGVNEVFVKVDNTWRSLGEPLPSIAVSVQDDAGAVVSGASISLEFCNWDLNNMALNKTCGA